MKKLIALSLLLTGCAHAPLHEVQKTGLVPIPCGPNDCGKTVVWEFVDPWTDNSIAKK